MHNISKTKIQDLANQIAQAVSVDSTAELLVKSRELYELLIVLSHQPVVEQEPDLTAVLEEKSIEEQEVSHVELPIETPPIVEEPVVPERELSIQERIERIMAAAPKSSVPKRTPFSKENIVKKTPDSTAKVEIEVKKPSTKEVLKKTVDNIENRPVFRIEKPIVPKESNALKLSLEEEFKDAISADLAANLFEKAEKVTPKKSLNESLSQAQIQIGLNDRIAFVKHLFNNSQVDFNEVLTQLNTFTTEAQALSYLHTVKQAYDWTDKIPYEERFLMLIERRFL